MLTADGKDVFWPYSDAPITTLTEAELMLLRPNHRRKGDVYKRCIAYARLTNPQFLSLHRQSGYVTGCLYRQIGKEIIKYDLEQFCENVSIQKLRVILLSRKKARKPERKVLIEELLAAS